MSIAWWFFVAIMPVAGIVFALDGVLLGAGDVVFLRNATMLCAVLGFLPAIWLSLAYDWGLAGIWAGLTVFVVLRMVAVSWRAFSGKWAVTGPATAKRGSSTEEAEDRGSKADGGERHSCRSQRQQADDGGTVSGFA